MSCCGARRVPGMSPSSAIVLGSESDTIVYARVMGDGESLAPQVRSGDQRYFTGTGLIDALERGLLMDVSAGAVRTRRVRRHSFAVVCEDGSREVFDAWRAAQVHARACGGRIEVVGVEGDA